MPALPFAASALPALKPNQPTHSMPAPATVNGRLCGVMAVCGKAAPLARAPARTPVPPTPALTCTTMPPAKSMTPSFASQPPPHTQCAIGT